MAAREGRSARRLFHHVEADWASFFSLVVFIVVTAAEICKSGYREYKIHGARRPDSMEGVNEALHGKWGSENMGHSNGLMFFLLFFDVMI